MCGEIVDDLRPLSLRRVGIGIGIMTAKTVAAVHGTGAGDRQQCTAVVLVQQAGNRHGIRFPQRVRVVAARCFGLLVHRQYLQQQRIMWITTAHPPDKTAWNPQREITGQRPDVQLIRLDIQQVQQFVAGTHRLRQFNLPGRCMFRFACSGYDSGRFSTHISIAGDYWDIWHLTAPMNSGVA